MRGIDQIPRWYAISTRYKSEKYVAGMLRRKRIEAYVPLVSKTKRYTRKIKTYDLPLINCYAFVRISRDQVVPVLETPNVVGFVKPGQEIVPVRDEEIQLLQRIVGEIEMVQAEPLSLNAGDRVEIISGNLTGLEGTLTKQNGKHEFVVELDSLGYQLRMVVDKQALRKVHKGVPLGAR
jgi:transcriptional antiterminator RfaH